MYTPGAEPIARRSETVEGRRVHFFVYGIDAEGVHGQLDELSEAHWAYMDRFAEQLVARGPTLSRDGTAHTGSIHILEAADLGAARQFAFEEPFARAGLYSAVTVTPWCNALGRTMWDRLPASPDTASTIVIARWPGCVCEPGERGASWRTLINPIAGEAFVFGGFLVGEGERDNVGLVFALDLGLPETERLAGTLGVPASSSIVSQRWSRGGRPS
jgi:uncharacterized protein